MRILRALLLLVAVAVPLAGFASPIEFGLDHGSVTLRIDVNGSAVASGAGTLDAGSVTFDPTALTIPTFSLAASGTILAPLLPGYNQADLSITLGPGIGYGSSGSGSNPTTVTLGPIAIGFSGVLWDGSPPPTPIPFAGTVALPTFTVDAYYNAGQMRLGLVGVKVASFWYLGNLIEIYGDIEFVGFAVPEPALAALVALSGLALLVLRKR